MARTLIRNISQQDMTLPLPYGRVVRGGDGTVVSEDFDTVLFFLGGANEIANVWLVEPVNENQLLGPVQRVDGARGIAQATEELDIPLPVNGQRITEVAYPVLGTDAANKDYVDAHSGGGGGTILLIGDVTGQSDQNVIAPLAVTTGKLADGAVTTAKLALGAVTPLQVAAPYVDGVASAPSLRTLGTGAQQAVAGNDPRLNNNRPPSGAAGGDLTGFYPNPAIAPLAVTDAKVATANKDGAASTPSMRTLGTGGQQACAGDDFRLSNARTPTGAAGNELAGSYPNPYVLHAYDIVSFKKGIPAPAEELLWMQATRLFRLSDIMSQHKMSAEVGPTGTAVVNICVNTSPVITATFAPGATIPTLTWLYPSQPNTLLVSGLLTILAPSVQDPTLAGLRWTLRATTVP